MDPFSICESGNATTIFHEPFSMQFEFTDFQVQENYEMSNDGALRRKITFPKQVSSEHVIGQSIHFPSSWRVNLRCKDSHARVALELRKLHLAEQQAHPYSVIKFKIIFIDKDGDTLYDQKWQSWQLPKRIELFKEHAKIDYISLVELFDNQAFFAPNKTLRILCEGTLFGRFVHMPVNIQKHCPFQLTPRPDLWESKEGSDIYLVAANGKSFKAHKLVLSKASLIFRRILPTLNRSGAGIPSLHLEKVTESDLANMLLYIYTGSTNQNTDWSKLAEAEKLIQLAKEYELRGLEWLCYKNVLKTISLSSFPQVTKMFQTNSVTDEKLRSILSGFFIKNQDKLVQSEKFSKFAREEKDAFLYAVLFNGNGNS